jgi:radial spoke head protein 9
LVYIDADLLSKVKIPAKGLTELDRLAYVVQQIDSDCQIIPRGAVKKTPLEEVRKNEAFKGLKADQAFSTSNYFHFRAPILKKNVELNARKEGIYNHDFLDNAEEDVPKGSWSVLKDTMGTVAVLRSKTWPGFYAFHKSNSDIYGGFYVGNGCKALDIAFMF